MQLVDRKTGEEKDIGMANTPVIEVKKATKRFGTLLALDAVDITLEKGEVLSILGPNGAGKTTIINALLGNISVTSDVLTVLELAPGDIHVRRQIGAMLQIADLPGQLTVKEHIQLFQQYYSNPMPYTDVIALTGLEEIEKRRSKKLSGGQKRRLLFALSICGNPQILFLDEPTVGLDIQARKFLWQAITSLRNQGKSIILTTHYLEEADQLSDRIVLLNKGKIIREGSPEEIKSQIQFKKIVCSTDLSVAELLSLNAVSQVEQFDNLVQISSHDPVASLRELFSKSEHISNLSVTGAALEDAFVELNRIHESKMDTTD